MKESAVNVVVVSGNTITMTELGAPQSKPARIKAVEDGEYILEGKKGFAPARIAGRETLLSSPSKHSDFPIH